ncbi:MAG: ABC transporter substrate-binding protein [Candidatus Nanoarchaeia archaeon]
MMKSLKLKQIKRISFFIIVFFAIFAISCAKNDNTEEENLKVFRTGIGGRVNTLDPALADDLVSAYVVGSLYDTLLQYDYLARPYKLIPSALAKMPELSDDMLSYKFTLRDDLYFQNAPCFDAQNPQSRKVRTDDVIFSILRVADARLHSPGFWLIRGKIKGIDNFYEKSAKFAKNDFSIYDEGCEGLEKIDDKTFIMHLVKPDPRMLYGLAMPYLAIVPIKAAKYYSNDLSGHSVGSGPFRVAEWMRDYRIILERNPEYRHETFEFAESPEDRTKPLPLLDRIECYLVKQALSGWLMFLQGETDISTLDKDNMDFVLGSDCKISPALEERGIRLVRVPEFQINYVGFNFQDPLLGTNLNLRRAISLAYNTEARIRHSNGSLMPAQGPIPPGVAGYDPTFENPWTKYSVEEAKKYLEMAGFPNGINPETGKPLEFDFDLGDTTSFYRQLAELMVDDMKKIGIKINPILNNKPRFFQKLKEGKTQIFRLSWVGDYPDAENFLQLFYGPNAGACNRTFFRDPLYDKAFEEIIHMPDCEKRTKKYEAMAKYVTTQCPWIFESIPTSYRLVHKWLENYKPHDFAYTQSKYLSINNKEKMRLKKKFKPLKPDEIAGGGK